MNLKEFQMYTDMDLEQINKLILEFEKRMKQIDLIITNIVIKEIE
ncbi:hypothetical protein [Thomasclavelia cocleata]|nr:hypothetical protein [Thomasclavelia cocleata]MCR1960249.1 hypothetical protein [Thomasclavelia cocleata]